MSKPLVTILGKAVRKVAQIRGGGSALPGLFVERIDPSFIKRTLANLPRGVVVISGTNGKTTTTKMVVELLQSQGLKVFTNRTGSNFTRGVAAALLGEMNLNGHLDADIAVLELDEAHAINFVRVVPPRYSLLLNVMRDQLDRYGEIDHTAKLLKTIAESTTETVVLNRDDARVAGIAESIKDADVAYFGLDKSLFSMFPNDDELHDNNKKLASKVGADVTLAKLSGQNATFDIDDKAIEVTLKLTGIYNVYNAAAALALVKRIIKKDLDQASLIKTLSNITPAFGRGETLIVNGQPLELVLVKNPSGFRLGLKSFDPSGYATMIAINDNYADGRDMSWLWDVDFSSLKDEGVIQLSGVRAYDMALRLQYDEVPIKNTIEPKLSKALTEFLSTSSGHPKRIYCTYTAMLSLRRQLSKMTNVEVIR